MNLPELLSPARDLDSVQAAIKAGADAIYIGPTSFNLRGKISNFSFVEIDKAVQLSHRSSRFLYVTVNSGPRDSDFDELEKLLLSLNKIPVDALIVWDPGVLWLIKQLGIDHKIHLSTMSCTLNLRAVQFWAEQGISRVNLARELSYEEVMSIKNSSPIQIEVFVHGSMCIAYAGRCILSNYLLNRDTHKGLCSTPCRWKYRILHPIDSRSKRQLFLKEDEESAYILNSKNLCLIGRIPELIDAGIDCLKIEGRQHNSIYVKEITSIYRKALDSYAYFPNTYLVRPEWLKVLKKYGERGYWEGFMFEEATENSQNFTTRGPSAKTLNIDYST
jgi:putative protease